MQEDLEERDRRVAAISAKRLEFQKEKDAKNILSNWFMGKLTNINFEKCI